MSLYHIIVNTISQTSIFLNKWRKKITRVSLFMTDPRWLVDPRSY